MSSNFQLSVNYQYEYNSSNDTETTPRKIENPKFYMVPSIEPNQKNITRSELIAKIKKLTKFHKDNESNLLKSSIGWHTLYEFFFSKIFFLKEENRENYLNVKEIQIRIRKEIGKIGQRKAKGQITKNGNLFTIFDKIRYNPPVSTWYEYNFLNDNTDKLISKKEESCYMPEIVKQFNLVENQNKEIIPLIRKIDSQINDKKLQNRNTYRNYKKKRTTLNLGKFAKSGKQNEQIVDTVTLQLAKKSIKPDEQDNKGLPFGLNKESKLVLKEVIIPKGAKKVVNAFIKKHKYTNFAYVEDEINNIKNNEKVYEVEMRNQNIMTSKFIKEHQFLFDFTYLKSSFDKEKVDIKFNMKSELENLFYSIDRVVDYNVNNIKYLNNSRLISKSRTMI